jgi:hypothetical protein
MANPNVATAAQALNAQAELEEEFGKLNETLRTVTSSS